MNETKKIRILQWSVALLLLCNIGLVVTIWLRPAAMHGGHETPRDMVIRQLNFNTSQVDKYDLLIRDHQDSMRRLRGEARDLRAQLFKGLENDISHAVNKDSLVASIGEIQKRIETVTYDHFAEVRKICTEAQKPVFDRTIGDVIKKMNGGPHGGPPGRDGEHRGDDGPPPENRPHRDN